MRRANLVLCSLLVDAGRGLERLLVLVVRKEKIWTYAVGGLIGLVT